VSASSHAGFSQFGIGGLKLQTILLKLMPRGRHHQNGYCEHAHERLHQQQRFIRRHGREGAGTSQCAHSAMPDSINVAEIAAREPKRNTAHRRMGGRGTSSDTIQFGKDGDGLRDQTCPEQTASKGQQQQYSFGNRRHCHCGRGSACQASSSGVTSSAPTVSPTHQVNQIGPDCHLWRSRPPANCLRPR
jgi:hypothetical protein